MFTGLTTDVGEVTGAKGDSFTIASSYDARNLAIGSSIACNGVCLTVTEVKPSGTGCEFGVDVSNETRSKTNLQGWQVGTRINLERPLTLGTELGGHVVQGHVDGVVKVIDSVNDGDCRRFTFEVPEHLAMYVAPKGSVALDGVSLTVNEVSANRFGVNIIPHTLTVTTWGAKSPGDTVNLEVDLLARYVARLMEYRS